MLVDRPNYEIDETTKLILGAIAEGATLKTVATVDPKRLRQGCYEIGHFSFDFYLPGTSNTHVSGAWDEYPEDLGDDGQYGPYGVCDDPDQFFTTDLGKFVESSPREFLVSFTRIVKAEQGPHGGWRWHKWGEYIGVHKPTREYLFDEPEIGDVWVFHVYERVEGKTRAGSARFG